MKHMIFTDGVARELTPEESDLLYRTPLEHLSTMLSVLAYTGMSDAEVEAVDAQLEAIPELLERLQGVVRDLADDEEGDR